MSASHSGSSLAGPRVFVSAVSNGLSGYRAIATEVLAAQGFVPIVKEFFPTPSQRIIEEIQGAISGASAGLFIIGPGYGFASPVPAAGLIPAATDGEDGDRLSYSQYEFFLAWKLRRRSLVLLARDACELDSFLPEDPRLRQLQEDFRKHIKSLEGRIGWHPFSDRFEFAKALAKFRWTEWFHG